MLVTRRRFKLANSIIADNDYVGTYDLPNNAIPNGGFSGSGYVSSNFILQDGTKYNGDLYEFFPRNWASYDNHSDTYSDNVFLESKHSSRDMEVTCTSTGSFMLLRAGVEGAIMFQIKSGNIEISRCSMAAGQAQFFLNHYNQIFVETDTDKIATWFNTVGNNSNTWTIGCKGIDIYIKRNGVEVVRVQDFDVVNPGIFAIINSDAQYGGQVIGPITVTHFNRVALYSDTDNNIIDLRDFAEFRVNATTLGSMDIADPYKLNVTSAVALKAKLNDYISVAAGGEAPQFGRSGTTRGMICVGGGYPEEWVDDEAALQLRTDFDPEQPIALRSTGEIWRHFGIKGESVTFFRALYDHVYGQQTSHYENYLIGFARGWDLRAKIIGINGNQLTLDRPCEVSTTNAAVWVDHFSFFNYLADGYTHGAVCHGKIFKLPAGDVYCSDSVYFNRRQDFALIGAGRTLSKFVTPKGCAFYTVSAGTEANNLIIKDFAMVGNYVESKVENDRDQWGIVHYNSLTGAYNSYHNNSGFGGGGIQMGDMAGGLIEGVLLQNYHNGCLHMQQAHNSVCRNSFVELWGDPKFYAAWCVGMDDGCTNCVMENIRYESYWRLPGFEFFGGNGNIIRNCYSLNGMISSNSGENAIVLTNEFHFEPNKLPAWQVPNNPLCNINGNNGRNDNSPAQVIGNSFYIYGADAKNNQTNCINVQSGRDGCLVKGNYIEYFDIPASDAQDKFAIGIATDSNDITIEDNTVVVRPEAWFIEGSPSNGCEIYINEGSSTGATIRRNTCHIIGAPIDNPTVCDIVTTGTDANNVDIIYWNYGAQWRKP